MPDACEHQEDDANAKGENSNFKAYRSKMKFDCMFSGRSNRNSRKGCIDLKCVHPFSIYPGLPSVVIGDGEIKNRRSCSRAYVSLNIIIGKLYIFERVIDAYFGSVFISGKWNGKEFKGIIAVGADSI